MDELDSSHICHHHVFVTDSALSGKRVLLAEHCSESQGVEKLVCFSSTAGYEPKQGEAAASEGEGHYNQEGDGVLLSAHIQCS